MTWSQKPSTIKKEGKRTCQHKCLEPEETQGIHLGNAYYYRRSCYSPMLFYYHCVILRKSAGWNLDAKSKRYILIYQLYLINQIKSHLHTNWCSWECFSLVLPHIIVEIDREFSLYIKDLYNKQNSI